MATDQATLPTTGQDDLFCLAKGYYTIRALLALWRLGLLERAATGEVLDAAAIASDSEVDPGLVRPLLDYLVVRGFLEAVAPGRYGLTERGRAAAPYYGYLSTMVGAYEPVLGRLEDLVAGRAVYGRDVVRSHAEMTRGLTALEDRLMGAVIDVVREAGARRVLDLGCGSAQMLARICKLSEGSNGVGVDRDPDSCAAARETVEREGLRGRLTILQGDAGDVASLPREAVAGVDLVTVMFLLHEILRQHGREGTVALLRSIAGLVGAGGRLVVVEVSGTSEPSYREDLLFVPEYELLHEYTNQRLAPRAEWEAMVGEAGMRVERFAPVDMCQAFCLVAVAEPAEPGGRR